MRPLNDEPTRTHVMPRALMIDVRAQRMCLSIVTLIVMHECQLPATELMLGNNKSHIIIYVMPDCVLHEHPGLLPYTYMARLPAPFPLMCNSPIIT